MTKPNRPLPAALTGLRLPMVAAPMFLVSGPDLVVAQCKAGIVGSFPALNAREEDGEPIALERWLETITNAIAEHDAMHPDSPAAPFAVNLIAHRSNSRLGRDVEILRKWKVPIWITSMGAREDVYEAAHSCGAVVFHDVINNRFARKAIEKGADGLIAVCAGAGGHAGHQSPFALIPEIRSWFDGPMLLAGSISTGQALRAALTLGADLGYVGSPFIATEEADAVDEYKRMIVDSTALEIVTTPYFSGVSANYLRPSIIRSGLDPDNLEGGKDKVGFDKSGSPRAKAWTEIWGSGQGIGMVTGVVPVADLVARFESEFGAP